MLTRGPFWPLRRVDASFLHLEYSLFEVYFCILWIAIKNESTRPVMLTRVPFWPLRRVSCIIYPLRILPICSIHFTLFRVQQKKTCCRGPPSLFQAHPAYRTSAFQGFFKPHNTPIYILYFFNILLNTSLIQVKSFVTYLLPTCYLPTTSYYF